MRQLRAQLEEIDKRLQGSPLPMAVLEDFKEAVDHLRSTLWTAMSATTDNPDVLASQLVNLRFFAGLPMSEAAELAGMSQRTAERQWAYARAWLQHKLESPDG